MVERTKDLEELEKLLDQYCKSEYPGLKMERGNGLRLSSIDGGGYCADGVVTFNIKDGEFTLDVMIENESKAIETKTFRFILA